MKQILLFVLLFLQCIVISLAQTPKGKKVTPTKPFYTGNTYALIIGISKYQLSPLNHLNYADSDAIGFKNLLRSSSGGNVPESNIKLLLDSNATLNAIQEGLDWLNDSTLHPKIINGDRIFIYFSGHGTTIGNNNSLLLAHDVANGFQKHIVGGLDGVVQVRDLKSDYIESWTDMGKEIEVFLIVDACRSRADGDKISNFTRLQSALEEPKGDIVLLASENGKSSFEDDPNNKIWGGHGVFTYYLLLGMAGMAWVKGESSDSIITLGELESYLKNQVPDSADYFQRPVISQGHSDIRLSKFDSHIILSYKQKQQQAEFNDPLYASKDGTLNHADSIAQSIYIFFLLSLNKDSLIGDLSADYYFRRLENCSNPGTLKQEALYSLCTALGNDGQKIINIYLNSNLDRLFNGKIKNDENTGLIFVQSEKKMRRLCELREKYFRDNKSNVNIKARWLFLKARIGAQSLDPAQLDTAEAAIKQALVIDSTQPIFYHTLALIYFGENKPGLAIKEDEKAVKLSPNWSYAYNSLGADYCHLKQYPKGEQYFLKSIRIDSTNDNVEDAYNNLGNAYNDQTKYDTAEQYYLKAIALDSTYETYILNLAVCYTNLKQYEKAEKYVLKAIKIDSNNETSYNLLGYDYSKLGEYPKAINAYKKGLVINPKDTFSYLNIACAYSIMNEKQNALEYIELCIQNGYRDYNEFQTDTDFENIRSSPEFDALMKKYFGDKEK